MTAVQLTSAYLASGKKMSEFASFIKIYPQVLVNAKIGNEYKKTYMDNVRVAAAIDKLEKKFDGAGRVLIRPSGTEPLVRVMIEGDDEEKLRTEATALAKLIEEELG